MVCSLLSDLNLWLCTVLISVTAVRYMAPLVDGPLPGPSICLGSIVVEQRLVTFWHVLPNMTLFLCGRPTMLAPGPLYIRCGAELLNYLHTVIRVCSYEPRFTLRTGLMNVHWSNGNIVMNRHMADELLAIGLVTCTAPLV